MKQVYYRGAPLRIIFVGVIAGTPDPPPLVEWLSKRQRHTYTRDNIILTVKQPFEQWLAANMREPVEIVRVNWHSKRGCTHQFRYAIQFASERDHTIFKLFEKCDEFATPSVL
jgi:hypothetical protein